jgi:hypothetical protein
MTLHAAPCQLRYMRAPIEAPWMEGAMLKQSFRKKSVLRVEYDSRALEARAWQERLERQVLSRPQRNGSRAFQLMRALVVAVNERGRGRRVNGGPVPFQGKSPSADSHLERRGVGIRRQS